MRPYQNYQMEHMLTERLPAEEWAKHCSHWSLTPLPLPRLLDVSDTHPPAWSAIYPLVIAQLGKLPIHRWFAYWPIKSVDFPELYFRFSESITPWRRSSRTRMHGRTEKNREIPDDSGDRCQGIPQSGDRFTLHSLTLTLTHKHTHTRAHVCACVCLKISCANPKWQFWPLW